MDNQHRKITGYRELSQDEIDLMNDIKAIGPTLDDLVKRVQAHISTQRDTVEPQPDGITTVVYDEFIAAAELRLTAAEPERWADWARGSFQTGLMQLIRAVAQPTSF